MKLINIGFGNLVSQSRLPCEQAVTIVSADNKYGKRNFVMNTLFLMDTLFEKRRAAQ